MADHVHCRRLQRAAASRGIVADSGPVTMEQHGIQALCRDVEFLNGGRTVSQCGLKP
jgi:hypothetical protein